MAASEFVLPEQLLSDEVLALRPLVEADLDLYQLAAADTEINQRFGPLPEAPELMLARARESWRSGSLAVLAICPLNGPVVGVVMLEPGPVLRANLGYWLLEAHRGKGYATRALGLASRWAFWHSRANATSAVCRD
jgi:RimJ/RimL family protein N-acetyltransferase